MLDWDLKYQLCYGLSWVTVVVSALSIVAILVHLEASNGTQTMMQLDTENPLALSEEQEEEKKDDNEPQSTSPKMEIELSRSSSENNSSGGLEKPRRRRVRQSFKMMQLLTVGVLVLLTYLLLVITPLQQSLSFIASFCVWVVFMRYAIGQELRRKRLDRLILIVSLFLVIAGALSMATFSYKNLVHGEIYEGPARIVGYDPRRFNNSKHEPMMRTDLTVEFGYAWACPQTPSTYCKAPIEGALCQYELPEKRRFLDDSQGDMTEDATDLEEQLEETEQTEEELREETNDLEAENEELEAEIEALENEEAEEDAEAEEIIEETEEEADEAVEEAEEIYDEEEEAVEEYTDEVAEEYDEATEEYYPDYHPNVTQTTAPTESTSECEEVIYSEDGEEYVTDCSEEILYDDYWYAFDYDYTSYEFTDDYFDSEYWNYDGWDDMWGDYTCSDLFEDDLKGHVHASQDAPGSKEGDDWPTINVFASCKTCEAYVLDYFAEEAFERRENYQKQAILYISGAAAGFALSFLFYLQHLAMPTKENEVELLSSYGGVVA